MRSLPVLAGLTAVALLAAACGTQPAPSPAPAPPTPIPVALHVPAAAAALVAADDRFGLDLLDALPQEGNEVISPASVAVALQMVAAGATGATATELATVLHLPDAASAGLSARALLTGLAAAQRDPTTTLKVADTVWTQQGLPLAPAYVDTLRTDFAAATHSVDFRTDPVDTINATVARQTAGLIPHLFPPGALDASARLVLTNAVYLRASWATAFPTRDTAPGPFTTGDGSSTRVPMMHSAATATYGYATGPGYQAVTLPYTGGQLGLTVLLPATSLSALTQTLRDKGLPAVLSGIAPARVTLVLPRFSVRTDTNLTPTLMRLGMVDAFADSANFTGISPQPLRIQTVEHDAVVHVDEHGTTAAAATGIGLASEGVAVEPVIDVDHPFLFVITDTATGAPLFLGRVTDPGN